MALETNTIMLLTYISTVINWYSKIIIIKKSVNTEQTKPNAQNSVFGLM